MSVIGSILIVLGMLLSLLLVPLGLPGLWLAVVLVGVAAASGGVSWTFVLAAGGAAALVEVGELLIVRRFGKKYGGSARAFWGAVLGGMAGLFVGVPVPLIGPLITGLAGTFVGAGAVTWLETRSVARSSRVGWGVVVARTLAVGMKVGVGVALAGATALALIL